jgi:hypothetical protein
MVGSKEEAQQGSRLMFGGTTAKTNVKHVNTTDYLDDGTLNGNNANSMLRNLL